MLVLKEEQSKAKANPPGTSKILARARRKAMEEVEKNVSEFISCFPFVLSRLRM